MKLPQEFAERMNDMLEDEYEAFVSAYDRPNTPSLRLNPAKCKDARLLSCMKEGVLWAEHGYYYDPDAELRPGKHPYHEAGVYYIQESSAMISASLCPPIQGDKVLDLCAAPGGKSTQLAAALGGTGVLVANEIHPQRASILSQNIERMGIANAVVTNHAPHELEKYFAGFFDKIVVDAPCSGEGMFRKEEQALAMWSRDNVELCAKRQKEILESAAKMLAPDGYLTYSTCTFAPEENEGVILSFITAHPEFEVVDPKNPAVLTCIEQQKVDRGNPDWVSAPAEYAAQIKKTVRIFPHHTDGEGHFAALLHKSADFAMPLIKERRKDKKKTDEKAKSKDWLTPDKAYKLFLQFSESITAEQFSGIPCLFGEQLYMCPHQLPEPKDGMRILRHGLHLGSVVKGERFEPSHALALALDLSYVRNKFAVDLTTSRAYLHGDTLPCTDEKGWYLVTLDGFSLGWGKASGGMMKNHYPKGLRKSY